MSRDTRGARTHRDGSAGPNGDRATFDGIETESGTNDGGKFLFGDARYVDSTG